MTADPEPAGASGPVDPIELTRALIRCPSVTPADAGALDVLQAALEAIGFACYRLPFGGDDGSDRVDNLFARIGTGTPHFCFAGHTDVVPVGEREAWSVDPFGAEMVEGVLYGRGAADMKGAIASFTAAVAAFLAKRGEGFAGSLSLLITGDEEGPAVNGTVRVLQWMAERDELPDLCLVGEPTNPETLGEMIKIGRRGSLNGRLIVPGTQGHVAYPHRADNPLPRMIRLLAAINEPTLDEGSEHFQPSNLEVTSVDVGNTASNVIPGKATAAFNIRFNDRHSSASLSNWLRERLDAAADGAPYELDITVSGESFYTPPGPLSDAVANAVESHLGQRPELSTSGGTSDARFIRNYCPVVEFGLIGQTMHKTDERMATADLTALTGIYGSILERIFAAPGSNAEAGP